MNSPGLFRALSEITLGKLTRDRSPDGLVAERSMTIAVGFNPRFRRPPGARRGATLEIIGERKGSLIPNLANDLAVKKVTFVVLNCVPIQKCTVFVFKGAASMMLVYSDN
ncbi:MAG: hypothetical protein JWM99_3922 [Verrucomicrobiales bacterium]|nr:hypothetical protein [Verrucomicrobiales bacterium]